MILHVREKSDQVVENSAFPTLLESEPFRWAVYVPYFLLSNWVLMTGLYQTVRSILTVDSDGSSSHVLQIRAIWICQLKYGCTTYSTLRSQCRVDSHSFRITEASDQS